MEGRARVGNCPGRKVPQIREGYCLPAVVFGVAWAHPRVMSPVCAAKVGLMGGHGRSGKVGKTKFSALEIKSMKA